MADVLSDLKNWSTTESNNSPNGSTTIGTNLDDNLRQIQATVRQDLATKGADIASAATTDLGAVAGLAHDITGTTTITSFGTVSAGVWKLLRFTGSLTLTFNATSLILPGGASIVTQAGDTCIAMSLGSGNWLVYSYDFAGTNIFPSPIVVAAGSASAPSITTSGDVNTGIYFPAADTVGITVGGSHVGRVTSGGNLVVGSTAVTWDERISARIASDVVGIGAYSSDTSYTSTLYRGQAETAAGTGWSFFEGRSAGGGDEVYIYGNGDLANTNNVYGAISDEAIKENIRDARSYTSDLKQVKVRKYINKKNGEEQIGVVAQEIAQVFPGLVQQIPGTSRYYVKYSVLPLMMLTMLQDLVKRVEALEAK